MSRSAAADQVAAAQAAGTSVLSQLEADVHTAYTAECTKFTAGLMVLKQQLVGTAGNVESELKAYLIQNAVPLMQALAKSAVAGQSKFMLVQSFLLNAYKTDVIPALGATSVLGWIESEVEVFAAAQGLSWLGPMIQALFNLGLVIPK